MQNLGEKKSHIDFCTYYNQEGPDNWGEAHVTAVTETVGAVPVEQRLKSLLAVPAITAPPWAPAAWLLIQVPPRQQKMAPVFEAFRGWETCLEVQPLGFSLGRPWLLRPRGEWGSGQESRAPVSPPINAFQTDTLRKQTKNYVNYKRHWRKFKQFFNCLALSESKRRLLYFYEGNLSRSNHAKGTRLLVFPQISSRYSIKSHWRQFPQKALTKYILIPYNLPVGNFWGSKKNKTANYNKTGHLNSFLNIRKL